MEDLKEAFGPFEEKRADQISPLTLAYIGDAFYELLVRTILIRQADRSVNRLNKAAREKVRAEKQSGMIGTLEPFLSSKEMEIYHRGRNAKSHTHAKNAGIGDYRRATGFEALMGYLYLEGEWNRAIELIRKSL